MEAIDAMPRRWRSLVHEHGFVIVRALFDEDVDLATAEVFLAQRRRDRQDEWLATSFITLKARHSLEARY